MNYDAMKGNRRPTPPGLPFAGKVTELLAALGNGCGGAVIKEVLPC